MRSKLGLFVIMLAVLIPVSSRSALVTSDEALTVASNFLEYMVQMRGSWGGEKRPEIASCRDLTRGGLLLGYHLSVHPTGHIVVSVLKDLSPVKSFSFTEDFETDSEEGYWLLLKDAMEYTLLAVEDRYGPLEVLKTEIAPAKVGEQWDWLLGAGMAPATIDTVGPLVKTKWGQGVPFNDSCPMGDGGRCVVGCVATAGCQIMRYWRHPSYGTGSYSYYWNGDQSCGGSTPGQTLSADFNHPYDWWNMKRQYITYDSTQAAAVADFCSDVGIAWRMDYGRCGSGTNTYRGVIVYPDFFKYLDTVTQQNRSDYDDGEAWFARIKEEFDASPPRPIHYRIHSHSIVCDGYIDAGTNYIHLNYGWKGSSDDWYAVDELYCPWEGCDPMVEYMLCGIEPGADFIDATAGPVGDAGDTYGVAWGDYDNDGDPDLYVVNAGTANKLLRNEGGGVFMDVTSGPLGDTGEGRAAVWGDFDNDGNLDLYVTNTSGQANKLLINYGGGTFVDVTSGDAGDTGNGESAAWADYNNDGYIDLYVVNNGSANKLLRNKVGGLFMDVTPAPLADAGNGYGVAWGDYDNDGDPDIYLANDGANKLFRNDGGGLFADVTSSPLDDTDDGRGLAWADYDNDGDLDIYLANNGTENKLFRNEGAGVFTDATSSPLANAGTGLGVAWGDYNNDGYVDLYLTRGDTGNRVYRNIGDGTFGKGTVPPLEATGTGQAVAWGDYDGDGLIDLYVANSAGSNYLFHNEYQPDNHWIQVRLVGVYSNAVGIGARVRVVAGGMSQIREISGGSGYCSQNSLVAEFGLGDFETVDTVEVIWPSGIVTDTTLVAADQLIEVLEIDISGVREIVEARGEFRLFPSQPNPFDRSTLIRYALPQCGPARIRVYDVTGRVVRVLVDSPAAEAGEHAVRWDGTNDDGSPVASGVYFYHLEAGSQSTSRRTVFLR